MGGRIPKRMHQWKDKVKHIRTSVSLIASKNLLAELLKSSNLVFLKNNHPHMS